MISERENETNKNEIVTYYLRDENGTSGKYYERIKKFSDEVLLHAEENVSGIIDKYQEYVIRENKEKIRSRGEYIIEFLTMGMTWNRYLGASQTASKVILFLLIRLFLLRNNYKKFKPVIDRVRGICLGSSVVPAIGNEAIDDSFSLANFSRLILWLEAAGEFKDEVKRLKIWERFLSTQQENEIAEIIHASQELIIWFGYVSQKQFGEYLPGIKTFLEVKHKEYRFREDEIFTGKQPIEYFLNMVGAEIMNRGFKPEFDKASKYVLLVPGCMRYNQEQCKAIHDGLDIKCTGCNKTCRVRELNELGKKNNFEVFIVPHSSSFSLWLQRWQKDKNTGLIAVACLLNLVPGGYEMRELNLNAQCVLLDYCGCKNHWHNEGIPTDLNSDIVLQLIRK